MGFKKLRKTSKNYYFWCFWLELGIFESYSSFIQNPYFVKSWGLMHCFQCIRTLLLSYQKHLTGFFSLKMFTISGDPSESLQIFSSWIPSLSLRGGRAYCLSTKSRLFTGFFPECLPCTEFLCMSRFLYFFKNAQKSERKICALLN